MIFSIIIPAFNEENSIASIIKQALRARQLIIDTTKVSEVEVIVVDDGSTDQTAAIASAYKEITLISHEKNKGYGAAIKTGFEKAHGQLLGFIDADGTCSPMFFSVLIDQLFKKDADMVIGSRLGPQNRMPKLRRLGNTVFAVIVNYFYKTKITDCASGMRVLKKSALTKLEPLPDGLHFTPAMSCKAIMSHNLSILEVPITYAERTGHSKLNVLKDGVKFLKTIAEIALFYKPLRFLVSIGFIFILIGLVYSVYPLFYFFIHRHFEDYFIYRLTAIVVAILVGMNFIAFGVFSQRFLDLMLKDSDIFDSITYTSLKRILKTTALLFIGCFISLAGILMNIKGVLSYLTTGKVYIHWALVLMGAALFLLGMQIIIFGLLNKILNMYKEHKNLHW